MPLNKEPKAKQTKQLEVKPNFDFVNIVWISDLEHSNNYLE